MQDMVPESVTPVRASDVYVWLGYGTVGAIAAAVLGIVRSALTLNGWPQGGFGLPEVLDLATLVPLAVVMVAYYKLSLATGAVGLRRSALGLFGMLVVLDLGGLNASDGGGRWWNIAIWVVLALATGLLLLVVWNLVEFEKEVADDTPAGPAPPAVTEPPPGAAESGGRTVGAVLGVIGFVGWVVLKVGLKVAGFRAARAVGADGAEAVVLLSVLVLAVIFVVWFAVAKIRLRHVLGPLAAAVGALELFAVLLFGMLMTGLFWDMNKAVERAGVNEQAAEANLKAVEDTWTKRAESGFMVMGVLWAAFTAGLFMSHRGRLAADQDGPDVSQTEHHSEPSDSPDRQDS